MHPILAMLGTLLLSAANSYKHNALLAIVLSVFGGAAMVLAQRDSIPVLKRIPGLVEPGSLAAGIVSAVLLLIGLGTAGLAIAPDFASLHPLASPAATFVSAACFLFFDRKDVGALKGGGGPVAFVALALACMPACPNGCNATPGRLIQCGSEAIASNAGKLVPAVQACLAGASFTPCLLGLIDPASGITEDMIACMVEREASKARASDDSAGQLQQGNARAFLSQRGYRFAGE